jgi:hypothetical protein
MEGDGWGLEAASLQKCEGEGRAGSHQEVEGRGRELERAVTLQWAGGAWVQVRSGEAGLE